MAIDYQRILMDMNQPRRRQGGGLKKLIFVLFVLGLLGGGAFALWHYGIAGSAWERASGLAGGLLGSDTAAQAPASGGTELTAAPSGSLRPETASSRPPAEPAAIPADSLAVSPPVRAEQAGRPSAASPSQPVSSLAPPPAVPAQPAPAPGPAMAPVPVLSDAKAQLRVIDQALGSDPADAMRRTEELLRSRLQPDDAADAGYRLGYAARLLRDEEKAEKSWKDTAEKYPEQRGGRFAALALAETWYQRYAGDRPQLSFWDDMQRMYSRAIGQDDAPFLPENIKADVKTKLNRINDAIFFGTGPTKMARYHKVESGELLGSIANKYRVDYESIARINGINPNRIRVGMDLKVVVGEVNIIVRKNTNSDLQPTLTWFLDGRWMREYPTCVGVGDKTPAGTYNLTSKERDPSWTNPLNGQLLANDHPDNILGSRWMAMAGMNTQGLGIHGTTVDDSIPGYTSAGCVRLHNKDVEELFSFSRITNQVVVLE